MFGTIQSISLLVAVQLALTDASIVNGTAVSIRKIPHQVAVVALANLPNGQYCGGSLISTRWVLTAAHCANGTTSTIGVRVGSSYHCGGGQLHTLARMVVHPEYNNKTVDNDFALLELERPVAAGLVARPIALPASDEMFPDGMLCTVSGWGNTLNTGKGDKLRAVDVPIANHDECSRNYAKNKIAVTETMICAGYREGKRDSCKGDSGGPLTCNGKLAGVVSQGIDCARKNYYGIYASVTSARNWIKELTGI